MCRWSHRLLCRATTRWISIGNRVGCLISEQHAIFLMDGGPAPVILIAKSRHRMRIINRGCRIQTGTYSASEWASSAGDSVGTRPINWLGDHPLQLGTMP